MNVCVANADKGLLIDSFGVFLIFDIRESNLTLNCLKIRESVQNLEVKQVT